MAKPKATVLAMPAAQVVKALKAKRKKWQKAYHDRKNGLHAHLAKLIVAVAKEL